MEKEIAIVGGGASGLYLASVLSGDARLKITIFEQEDRVGKKLLQTGNGRCNLLNMNLDWEKFNSPLLKPLIAEFSAEKIFASLQALGLELWVDASGRVYPYSDTATTVLNVFLKHLQGVNINTNEKVLDIKKQDGRFLVTSAQGSYFFDIVVLAAGSIAGGGKMPAGYEMAVSLGHRLTPLYPSLCPLKVEEKTAALAGIRVKCLAKIFVAGALTYQTKGEVLFKKDGLSGIAVLDLSKYFVPDKKCVVSLDLYPEKSAKALNQKLYLNNDLKGNLIGYFPKMLNLEILKRAKTRSAGDVIKDFSFNVSGCYDFKSGQVVRGGIDLQDIDLESCGSKIVKDLYFTGEILDVDGICGGYNLYFAFASAACVARAIKKSAGQI